MGITFVAIFPEYLEAKAKREVTLGMGAVFCGFGPTASAGGHRNYGTEFKENTVSQERRKRPNLPLWAAVSGEWGGVASVNPPRQVCSHCRHRVTKISGNCWNTFFPRIVGEPTG